MSIDTRGVQTDLATAVDRNNEKVNEIIRLIGAHCTFGELKKFHRPISMDTTKFPACYVQPKTYDPTLEAEGLEGQWGEVLIYVYHADNAADRVGEDTMATVSVLRKLFSRNALDDMETAAPTAKYFVNGTFWVESKFGPERYGEVVGLQKDAEQLFVVQAQVTFRYHDVVLP